MSGHFAESVQENETYGATGAAQKSSLSAATPVVIAGGGPTGLYTAAVLYDLGHRNVTVLEKETYDAQADPARSYVFGLNIRGKLAIARLPELHQRLRCSTPVPDTYTWCLVSTNSHAICLPPSTIFGAKYKPGMLFFRPRFIQVLREYVEDCCSDGVNVVYGTRVTNVTFIDAEQQESGEDVEYGEQNHENSAKSVVHCVVGEGDEAKERTFHASLLLGCDGINSVVVQALHRAGPEKISSKKAFYKYSRRSPSSGKRARSIVLRPDVLSHIQGVPEQHGCMHWTRISGKRFSLDILPMMKEDIEKHGGLLALVFLSADDKMWRMTDADELYEYFEENFPQINVRASLTRESAKTFLKAKYVTFPAATRMTSLAGTFGSKDKKRASGVILLGDSSHHMDPVMGQGLNSSLEDVMVLERVLVSREEECGTVAEVAEMYERRRIGDVKALVEIVSGRGILGLENMFMKWLQKANTRVRDVGAEWFPGLIAPPVQVMIGMGLPYSEARRRQVQTTWVLVTFVLIMLVGVGWGVQLFLL